MRLTVRRVKLDRGGFDRHGEYYGTGDPVYFSPEVEDAREGCSCYYRESPYERAPNVRVARELLRRKLERMMKPHARVNH